MTSLVNTLRKQVDLPIWEWLRFAPIASAVPSASCAANNSQYNLVHGRYVYFMITAANFWRYDTWTDTYEQLQTPPIAPATWCDIEMAQGQMIEGFSLGSTTNTITIPAYSSQALQGYDIKIIGGTGAGQRRIISSVAEPTIADFGTATATANALGGITITDSTKAWNVNEWAGYQVRILAGSGVGQVRRILYNSATVLTISDSTMSAQNVWTIPNIYSPAISFTAGSQSIYAIESSVCTVDSNWLVQPDNTSQYRVESGMILCASSAATTPFYTMQYYDIIGDCWYIKTAQTLLSSIVGTDGTIDSADFAAAVWTRGTSTTTGTVTTLTDSTKSWSTNSLAGYYVYFCGGTGEGQISKITSNTNEVLTFAAVTTAPDSTTDYLIEGYDCGTVTTGGSTTLTDSSKSWPTNRYANFMVSIVFGTGKGQNLQIASNTATSLTFVKPLTTAVDTTSVYIIIPDADKTYMMLGGQAETFIYNYTDDLTTLGRMQDSGIACNGVVLFSTQRPIAIASLANTTTNAVITTAESHNLKIGQYIRVLGCTDSNFNTPVFTANFATNQMTLTTNLGSTLGGQGAGLLAIGNLITGPGIPLNTIITSLASGSANQSGAVYNLSTTPGTLSSVTTTAYTQITAVPIGTTLQYTMAGTPAVTTLAGTQNTTVLYDSSKNWTVNQWSGYQCHMTASAVTAATGLATGQAVQILENTSDALVMVAAITTPINGVTRYIITPRSCPGMYDNGLMNGSQSVTQVQDNFKSSNVNVSINAGSNIMTVNPVTFGASFANGVMTITTAPVNGTIGIYNMISGTSIPAGAYISSLASGTANVNGATYNIAIAGSSLANAGGQGSLSGTTMTVTTVPTTGIYAPGQTISGTGITAGTTIVSVSTTAGTGINNSLGCVYNLSQSVTTEAAEAISGTWNVGTISAETVTAYPAGFIYPGMNISTTASTGGQMSFATNVANLTTAPTFGVVSLGQTLMGAGGTPALVSGNVLNALASGALNATSSTYTLQGTTGTIGAEAITTTNTTGSSGGSASFATNVMTLTVAPTVGSIAIGQEVIGASLGMTGSSGGSASFSGTQMTVTVSPTLGSVEIGQTVVANGVPFGTTVISGTGPYTLSNTVGTIAAESFTTNGPATYITGLLTGNLNATSSTYSLSTTPGTVGAESITTTSGAGSFGASASFANNQMTLTVAPTVGAIGIGQIVTAGTVAIGTYITGLVSGTYNAVSSVYSLSTYPGTVGAESIVTSALPVGAVIAQQLTSTAPGGIMGSTGTYQLSMPSYYTLQMAQVSYGWVINQFAGRKIKVLSGAGQGATSEVFVTSNTPTTLTISSLGGTGVTLSSAYAILQQPARGTGISLQGIFGLTTPTNSYTLSPNSGKYWVCARGGAAVGFDKLDITTDTFYLLPTTPQTETLTTGSMYAYDGQNRVYFTKEATQRVYYIDLNTNTIHGAGMYPYAAPTALLGNRMEIFTTADGLKYLWLNRETNLECFRQLLFY